MTKSERKQLYEGVGENYNRVYLRLMNPAAMDREKLERMPYEKFLDLAVVFYMKLEISKDHYLTLMVNNDNLESWGMEKETLVEMAWENTIRDNKPFFSKLSSLMKEMGLEPLEDMKNDDIYILSNCSRELGASVIMYPGLLKKVAKELGTDFYVIPSSIHECLIVKCDGTQSPAFLRETVAHVNATEVDKKDVLSNNIYRFNSAIGRLLIDMS